MSEETWDYRKLRDISTEFQCTEDVQFLHPDQFTIGCCPPDCEYKIKHRSYADRKSEPFNLTQMRNDIEELKKRVGALEDQKKDTE